MNWIDVESKGNGKYCQTNEEHIIQHIFDNIGITNKFCVEFGAGNGSRLSNTKLLRDGGWDCLLMDAESANPDVRKEFITAENINKLFAKYSVPHEFDLLSIDLDGNDYWVWNAIVYKPRVVVIEYNPTWEPYERKTIVYNPNHVFDGTSYYGASIGALCDLGSKKDMNLIYYNKLNAFFVRSDALAPDCVSPILPPKRRGGWPPDLEREWVDV